MLARDIMTTGVVSVGPDTGVRDIARLLAAKGISAVPVVDASGSPIGMVSEGDLIGRSSEERDARRDWWLSMLAEGEPLNADYLASLRPADATAAAIMSAPVITVSETTEVAEIARILSTYHIKRVPVIRDDRIIGIVSRADLVRALAASAPQPEADRGPTAHGLFGAISALDDRVFHARDGTSPPPVAAPATLGNAAISAARFRELLEKYRNQRNQHREEQHNAALEQLRERVKDLTVHHVADDAWQAMLVRASAAAEHGDKEFLLLRFPNALCSDGGRAVNAPLPDWPKTLRGEPAEIYLRWERDLKPRGFHLAARVLEFPGGLPGDIGLFLSWDS